LIAAPYTADNLAPKALNKKALRTHCGLQPADGPVFGMVGRLTEQKGVDFILAGAGRLLAQGGQLAALGRGDAALEQALVALAADHPGQVHVTLGFDERLAHLIEAGADCFLMPSRFEPCGLNQMYSQAYGTPPLVAYTGGLADTVTDVDADLSAGTGFVMPSLTQPGFDAAVARVFAAWSRPLQWAELQKRCMAQDFGWARAARAYVDLYELLAAREL
jgi:starch synthase